MSYRHPAITGDEQINVVPNTQPLALVYLEKQPDKSVSVLFSPIIAWRIREGKLSIGAEPISLEIGLMNEFGDTLADSSFSAIYNTQTHNWYIAEISSGNGIDSLIKEFEEWSEE